MAGAQTVLVVDDEPAIRMLCRLNLELDGYRVVEAESITAARRAVETESVDVVLLDVHVGGEDGRTLLDELTNMRSRPAIAMLTGDTTRTELVAAGADAVIGKPFTLDELRDTVQKLAPASG